MAKNKKGILASLRHRAVCEDDSFKGVWRPVKGEALADARTHRDKPGNGDHVIRIVTEQTSSELF